MDEILRPARPEAGSTIAKQIRAEQQVQGLRDKFLKAAHRIQTGAIALGGKANTLRHKLDGLMAGRKMANPLPFLALAGIAGAVMIVSTMYIPSYVVTVDGVTLGTVAEPAVFEEIVDRVETRAAHILGHDYTLEQDVEYSFALTQKGELSPAATFETYLFNHVGDVMKSYVLSVDGQLIGAAMDREVLDSMLSELSAPYINENTVAVDFVEDVTISYEFIASDVEQDVAHMNEVLTSTNEGEATYTVVSGDTYSGIAYANNMSVDELMALNPGASLNSLMVGDVLTVQKIIPFLSVQTVEAVEYDQEIECPVEYVNDSTMYQGNTKTLQAGTPGVAHVTAEVTYVNGYEESRLVTSSTTIREATTTIVAVGTKERPKTLPTGSLQWPVYGNISSYYGWRTIFGAYDFHTGIDIVAGYGTPIAAADGGTVIWSGYQGSYGYLVIIEHGGVQTYYAHCSSLLVSAGDKVYKGQTISLVGSTGRSTGNHLHFEVRINGSHVNPLSYLP